MKQPRTVMFAVAAHGDFLNLLQTSLSALANLLCLGASHGPLPRLGICALELAAKTGKVQLKVKLRPSELNLYDFHAAALKIQATSQQTTGDPLDGSQAALALKSLTQVLLQDGSTNQANKTIVLVTDHLMRASDFDTYFSIEASKRSTLKIIILCDADADGETSSAACDWEEAEARHPGLTVTIVPVAGKVAVQYVARSLLSACSEPEETASLPVSLEFPLPFLGNLRTLQLEAHCEIRPLNLSVSHCIVCACHSAPLALHGAPTDATSATTPLSLQRAFRCPITGSVLSPAQCVQDGKAICVGNTVAGVLYSSTPLSLTGPSTNTSTSNASGGGGGGHFCLRVLNRINTDSSPNAGLILGPYITLKPSTTNASHDNASVKVALGGEKMVTVTQKELLTLVIADLKEKNQGLMVESSFDLHNASRSGGGGGGLFKFHYMLIPAQKSYGPVFCALRLASIEELAHQTVPASSSIEISNGQKKEEAPPPAEVVAAVQACLRKVPEEEPNKVMPRSSRVHETLEMLIGEARPPPKLGSTSSALASGSGGGGTGDGQGPVMAAAGGDGRGRGGTAGRGIPQGVKAINGSAPQAAVTTRAKGAPAAAPSKRRR